MTGEIDVAGKHGTRREGESQANTEGRIALPVEGRREEGGRRAEEGYEGAGTKKRGMEVQKRHTMWT